MKNQDLNKASKKLKQQLVSSNQLAVKLAAESKLVRTESIKVLKEFEKLDDEVTTIPRK